MRKMVCILTTALCAVLLTGCGCQHEWQEAACLTPKICTLCQETEGEALGHNWQEAACEAPKTCTNCGMTEGEAPGHSWQEATCDAPRICTACGATEGEPAHAWTDWRFNEETAMVRSCGGCGAEENCPMEEYLQELLAGHWDAVSVSNLNRRSEDDPHWKDVRHYYSEIPYMKILENGSHEMFAGTIRNADCRLEFHSANQVKVPPSEELCDAYHFSLFPEEGKGWLLCYVPREDAVFLMGFIRFERESEEMAALRDQLAGTWVYDSEYLYPESDTAADRSTYRLEFSREGTFRGELDTSIEGSWGDNYALPDSGDGVIYHGLYVVHNGNYRNTNVVLEISETGTRLRFDRNGIDRIYFVKE